MAMAAEWMNNYPRGSWDGDLPGPLSRSTSPGNLHSGGDNWGRVLAAGDFSRPAQGEKENPPAAAEWESISHFKKFFLDIL